MRRSKWAIGWMYGSAGKSGLVESGAAEDGYDDISLWMVNAM